jgi:hypothetical protein
MNGVHQERAVVAIYLTRHAQNKEYRKVAFRGRYIARRAESQIIGNQNVNPRWIQGKRSRQCFESRLRGFQAGVEHNAGIFSVKFSVSPRIGITPLGPLF